MSRADEMVAWLRTELGRREQVAERAEGTWRGVAEGWRIHILDEQGRQVAHLPIRLAADDPEGGDYATATLIEDHDPAAVLRRVSADRKILDLHAQQDDGFCEVCPVWPHERLEGSRPCATVRLLAEGYGWTRRNLRDAHPKTQIHVSH